MTAATNDQQQQQQQSTRDAIFYAIGFGISSSLLVVINKWTLKFAVSALVAFLIGILGISEVDALDKAKALSFMPAVCMFYVSVATNLKLLQVSNVETYIVVRSIVPICTLGLEMAYLNTPWPGLRTASSLLVIAAGAFGYAYAEGNTIPWDAAGYATVYLIAFTVDQVLIKKIVMEVKLTRWGLVYYNNLLALVLMPVGVLLTGEYKALLNTFSSPRSMAEMYNIGVLFPVGVSCLFGLGISFFALNARKALTATAFTVLGVVCKFGTVFVNTVAWDTHASPTGIVMVCICIAGGILFQQLQGAAVVTPQAEKTKDEPESAPLASVAVKGDSLLPPLSPLALGSSCRSQSTPVSQTRSGLSHDEEES